jgi:hypothetical protein
MGLIDGIVFALFLFFAATAISLAGFGELNQREMLAGKICVFLAFATAIGLMFFYLNWARDQSDLFKILTASAIGAVLCASTLGYLVWLDYRATLMLARNEGTLEPGNWDAPIHPNQQVNLPPTAIKVFLGPVLASSDKFPSPIIRVRGEPLFVVDRQKNSHLRITLLKVFDTRNDIIARIDDTGFWVSPGSRKSRPDKSTLIVFDNRDTEVLNVRYLNKTTLSILGSFSLSEHAARYHPT